MNVDITVVIMTRNRTDELMATLRHLARLPERPPIVVADNGSTDGTVDRVRREYPDVRVLPLPRNLGVEARNVAAHESPTPYIAFNDDDSRWVPGALERVVDLFDRHPRLGAVTAHIVVEPGGRDDPTSLEMQRTPLDGDASVPGLPVLGFLACATAVRRDAFLEVGGFEPRFHFGGEEELLATDLATAGWEVRYMPHLEVHHAASRKRNHPWRQRREIRNTLWYLWLRRPFATAALGSWHLLRDADVRAAIGGALAAAAGIPWVLWNRRVVPPGLEAQLRRLDEQRERSSTRQHAG